MIEINGTTELDMFILNNIDNVICLYFGATWCSPCKILKLKIEDEEKTQTMPKLAICYVDIDNDLNKEIIEIYDVQNLPTQIFIILNKKNHVKIFDKIIGYDWIGFKMMYEKVINKLKIK